MSLAPAYTSVLVVLSCCIALNVSGLRSVCCKDKDAKYIFLKENTEVMIGNNGAVCVVLKTRRQNVD